MPELIVKIAMGQDWPMFGLEGGLDYLLGIPVVAPLRAPRRSVHGATKRQ